MKLLVKIPTRERPERILEVVRLYNELSYYPDDLTILVSGDEDDKSMDMSTLYKLEQFDNCIVSMDKSQNKIHAINRDISDIEFDILVVAGDDMTPIKYGYDDMIIRNMQNLYPDLDGVLWFFDGHRQDLNTMPILGRQYYKRFNYVYHPSYKTWYCDNEFMLVANSLKKQTFIDEVIIRHDHYGNGGIKIDNLYKRNDHPTLTQADRQNYLKRRSKGFPKDV
jgi:hypothetical protein